MTTEDGFWGDRVCPAFGGGDDDLAMRICSALALVCIVVGVVLLAATVLPKFLGILLIAVPLVVMGTWAVLTQ